MSSWRSDPDLIRQPDEDDLQQIKVERRWALLFEHVEAIFVAPMERGIKAGAQRAALRGFLWQAKKKVAADPEAARSYVLDSLRLVCACLEVEPTELYLDREQLLTVLRTLQPSEAGVG